MTTEGGDLKLGRRRKEEQLPLKLYRVTSIWPRVPSYVARATSEEEAASLVRSTFYAGAEDYPGPQSYVAEALPDEPDETGAFLVDEGS